MTNFDDVLAFSKKYGIAYSGPPRLLPIDIAEFRVRFMEEELKEYKDAFTKRDLAAQFDALLDLAYVVLGTAMFHGFPWQEGWNEVQRANMTKVKIQRISDSKRGSIYDVIKPPDWRGPELTPILQRAWAQQTVAEINRAGFDESD